MSDYLTLNFRLYRDMLLVRRTEEKILSLFTKGLVDGTTHVCIGQEADAIGVIGQLDPQIDHIISNHRCHGHYLAFGGSLAGLFGEILGKSNGVCKGRGGSQHLKNGNFLSSGIQGGGAPIACGLAMGSKLLGDSNNLVTICLGDGTLGQGVLYEALNMASLWSLPVLFFLEDNGYAQSTPVTKGVAGSMIGRGAAFGIATDEITSSDILELVEFGRKSINYVRTKRRPFFAVVHTHRLCAHSKGDDTRNPDEVNRLSEFDPLKIHGARLLREELEKAEEWVERRIETALTEVEQGQGI